LSTIRKSIQHWSEDERRKKELSQILESFNVDCGELFEAIRSGIPNHEDQILERLSEEMSAKEYNRLVQALEGKEMKKYYSSEEKKDKLLSKYSEFE
jgi:predicted HTH transcriptional regulator